MRVELFYDIVSPWSYLCCETLSRYRDAWQLELVMRPAFLGGVMKATGNTPPASLPARGVYLMRDLARSSRHFDVPLVFPSEFPTNTIAPMRLLCLVERDEPARLEALSRALWRRYWGEGEAVKTDEALRAACAVAGVDASWCTRLQDDDVKQLLRDATDDAVNRGAFGFPAMFIRDSDGDEQMYFGSDRLALLAFDLGLAWNGPAGPALR